MEGSGYVGCQKADGSREVPVFTHPERWLLKQLDNDVPAAEPVEVEGEGMWRRMLDPYLRKEQTRVAVDPGEDHGVLLTRGMVLGMVNMYGGKSESAGENDPSDGR